MGGLRDPKNRKLRYASSVHESGHAIVMAALTGKIPTAIIGVDSERGGMTIVRDNETSEEIISKLDLENSVKIGLAGYYAELVVFKDEKKVLLGSGQDIEEAWDEFSKAIYSLGFFGPTSWANYDSSTTSKIPAGFSDVEISERSKELFDKWCSEVKELLKLNIPLIIKMTKKLVKTGSMTGEEFLNLIREGNNTIDLEAAKKRNSYEFYEEIIESYEG